MIRLALVGCGEVQAAYARSRPHIQNADFAAVVDQDVASCRAAAHALDASITTASIEDLLGENQSAFEAVLVHTDIGARAECCLAAARAGKHVYVETPIALSTVAADAVIKACRRADVCLMVGQELRFMPSQAVIMETLQSGKLGEPGLLRVHDWEALGGEEDGTHFRGPSAQTPLEQDGRRDSGIRRHRNASKLIPDYLPAWRCSGQ